MIVTELFKQNCLSHKQPLSNTLILLNVANFSEAIAYVRNLPYGRNSERNNYKLIIEEKRGTCSTKHAFIKALADENNIDLQLLIGIFLMTPANTPAISNILEKHNINAIPEAHCYLRYKNITFDITFPDHIVDPYELGILKEESIIPSQIGKYKVNFHREFIQDWIFAENLSISHEVLWHCREDCIQALSRIAQREKSDDRNLYS